MRGERQLALVDMRMSVAGVALSPVVHEDLVSFTGFCAGQLGRCSSGDDLMVLYVSIADSVVPVRVMESDTVASVKLRIEKCKGFVVKRQKLVFGGRELARNDSLVKDYGVTSRHENNVLHLILKLSDLLNITARTICGNEFEFRVDRHRNVGYLKQRIVKKGNDEYDPEDQELFCNGERLEDQRLIDDISKSYDEVVHLVAQKSATKEGAKHFVASLSNEKGEELESPDLLLEPIIVNPKIELPSYVSDMMKSTMDGMVKGSQPIRSSEGTGGTYFMRDSSEEIISVFKPIDEEPNAVNNPHGLPVSPNCEGLKRGTRVGEGAIREVAAFLLDHPKSGPRALSGETIGSAGVPPTMLVRCLHKGFNHPDGFDGLSKNVKIGSLQMFMKNDGSCEDMGPSRFPVEEVHKISVFDIRMVNADRHAGNIGQVVLVPIDHGYCLPENFEDCTFDWLYWPQARQPYAAEIIEYIKSLDAEQDIALLKFYGWDIPRKCARTLRVSTMLLKKGLQRGLAPFAIGNLMCRENINKSSVIEEIVAEAEDSLLPGMSEAAFLEAISEIMDSRLDKVGQ